MLTRVQYETSMVPQLGIVCPNSFRRYTRTLVVEVNISLMNTQSQFATSTSTTVQLSLGGQTATINDDDALTYI